MNIILVFGLIVFAWTALAFCFGYRLGNRYGYAHGKQEGSKQGILDGIARGKAEGFEAGKLAERQNNSVSQFTTPPRIQPSATPQRIPQPVISTKTISSQKRWR